MFWLEQCKDQNILNNVTLDKLMHHKNHLNDLIHEFVLAQEPERSQRIFWILQLRRQKEESNRALHFWLQVKVSKFVLPDLSEPGAEGHESNHPQYFIRSVNQVISNRGEADALHITICPPTTFLGLPMVLFLHLCMLPRTRTIFLKRKRPSSSL